MNIITIILIIVGIILGFSFFYPFIKGAPWIPTRMKKVRQMLSMVEIKPDEILYDLGCGDGRFIINAARKYKVKAVGIELNPLLYLWCQIVITILFLRRRVKIKFGNFFKRNLSSADVVICYLLPETNYKLEDKLIKELKPTARIISNSFVFKKLPVISEDISKGIFIYKAT